ncbi:hypothetical protein [Acinetobacter haemolyticus]|uniref:hypothetical protein n=1 Tax=Acinetobacter haemolyticus TaxID=29430 RepID=UPI00300AB243
MSITCVRIYLDKNVPEYMNGILRVGRVISEDEQGHEADHEDLVDNQEFHNIDLLKNHVASALKISKSIIEID